MGPFQGPSKGELFSIISLGAALSEDLLKGLLGTPKGGLLKGVLGAPERELFTLFIHGVPPQKTF